jgi:2-hydroxycyclohexanecarboxyl-CoA dehydrogenase
MTLAGSQPTASPFDLTDRVVLITGSGRGIGQATAERCAQHGATVIVNDFHADRATETADRINRAGHSAISAVCDVSDLAAVTAMVDEVVGELGRIDVLVNNAGNAGPMASSLFDSPPFWQTGPHDWTPWLATNFFGVLNATRACLPYMVERCSGRVINVISDAGRVGEASLAVYSGAKAGVAGFARGLAKAVGRYDVTVNCVALGSMNTDSVSEVTSDPTALRRMLAGYPIRRLGEPDDAANMIIFLASDAGRWITGQTYPVNGGYSFAV